MKKALLMVLAAFIAVVMLASCTGSSQPAKPEDEGEAKSEAPAGVSETVQESTAPGGGIIEPEQLISKQEAAGLMGDVSDGEKKEQPVVGQKILVYKTADGEGFLQISLTQQAFMSTAGNTPQSIYEATKDAISDPADAETAQGIGDEYFFGTPGLHILYKGYYICLAAGNPDGAAVRDILKQAGALAVKNLDALIG